MLGRTVKKCEDSRDAFNTLRLMSEAAIKDLQTSIAKGQVVAVVGTGVSAAATGNAAASSWQGLLQKGIAHCESFVPGLPKRWGQRQREALEDAVDAGDLVEMLAVAEQLSTRLGAPAGGEYVRWLRESLGADSLKLQDRGVIQALDALQIPIVTTNYDDLIERCTGLPGVTWKEKHKITRIVRGEDRAVLHIHGRFDDPSSVVLGIRDYESVRSDEHTQAVMQCLGFARSLLFIGCGEGLKDRNFGNLLQWLGRVSASDEYRNYRLALAGEVKELQKQHPPEQRILVLPYGDSFSALQGFLESLRTQPSETLPVPRSSGALSPLLDAYIQHLCEAHARLSLIGMGAGMQLELPIAEAYIPLRTCHAARDGVGRFDAQAFQEADAMQRDVRLEDTFRTARQENRRGVLLLGDPGGGKTTGARQLCWQLASGRAIPVERGLPAGTLPVFLRLRNLRTGDVPEQLETFVLRETSPSGPELWAFPGSLLWIFDGLDEVADEKARTTVGGWLIDLLARRKQDRVMVTGRYQGIEGKVDLGPEFVRFEVQPLDDAQSGTFVHSWFRAAYQAIGLDRNAAQEKSRSLAALLHEPSYRVGRMPELRSNPLLLTVLCLVYHEDSSLPRSRVRLYERCVKVLLETWRQQVYTQLGKGRPYSPDAARQVLASVAWWMHEQKDRRTVPLTDMEKTASSELPLYPNSGLGGDGREFIRLMREESGIVAASGAGFVEFLHLTFQEYLAALHAVQRGRAAELAGRISESWWQEVILLALAQCTAAFSESFFAALVNGGEFEQEGSFVERCLQESEPLIVTPLLDRLRSGSVSLPRKVALLRHLRSFAFPELLVICRGWLAGPDKDLASLSREILDRAGERIPAMDRIAGAPPAAWVHKKTGIAFVRIREGSFDMGDSDGRSWGAQPPHRVTLTQDFYLGKYSVTNDEFGRFLEATGHQEPPRWGDRRCNQPRQPVVGVSWEDAQAFCRWADCRLPTEAEWEYACRAGSNTAYSFGNEEMKLDDNGWYSANSGGQAQVVGSKLPNSWDLYDMHGNVWEWCEDWFADYTGQSLTDPSGPAHGSNRVIRGGSWVHGPRHCRSAYRRSRAPSFWFVGLGFRVARSSADE